MESYLLDRTSQCVQRPSQCIIPLVRWQAYMLFLRRILNEPCHHKQRELDEA